MIPLAAGAQMPGQIVVDPDHPAWLEYHGQGSFFLCAPGNPEGFLYRGSENPDGTRDGDQQQILDLLAPTGANGIYLMAVRSHGGDGGPDENPFVDHDPSQPLNAALLDQWEEWFGAMDQAGIVIFFFLYDDSARIWGSPGNFNAAEEEALVTALVDRFEHHRHLIWVIAEEYAERWLPSEISQLAAFVRQADDHDHPIAVHQNIGLTFDFPDDPTIDQFAIQWDASPPQPGPVHSAVLTAWADAAGRFNLNLSESPNWGTGPISRQNSWAAATAGAYVMHLDWDVVGTPVERLRECGYLRRFFELATLTGMAPADGLGAGAAEYVLAEPGVRYLAFTRNAGAMGFVALPPGQALLRWLDPVSGSRVDELAATIGGTQTFARPAGFGAETALILDFAPSSTIFLDGFESGDTGAWSSATP